jgi:hypothetical protein
MSLTRVVMHLGRNPQAGFPEGDDRYGYVIHAPLNADGHLDVDLWRENRAACRVDRLSPHAEDRADGWLTHRGSHWFFHYDEAHEGPDEPVFRLGDHVLKVGEYLTIHEADGQDLTFRITEARLIQSA